MKTETIITFENIQDIIDYKKENPDKDIYIYYDGGCFFLGGEDSKNHKFSKIFDNVEYMIEQAFYALSIGEKKNNGEITWET